jgi:DNA-binding SARP family transcriptional activator
MAERLGETPAALGHWLESGEGQRARSLFERCADAWLATDPVSVSAWFDRLFPEDAPAAAALAAARAHRAAGRPSRAWEVAERARRAAGSDPATLVNVLHLLAELALDTAEPARARLPLQAARRLIPRNDPRCLTHLRLETGRWIDLGRPRQARRLLAAQRQVGAASAAEEPPRLLLRTGRLDEARTAVERMLGVGTARGVLAAHREPALLLAYLDAALGRGARALAMAQRGILEAEHAGHLVTEAVAWIRLGHGHQVASPLDPMPALRAYDTAVARARAAGVERTEAEAHLGRVLAHGHAGALREAEEAFALATSIATRAGDRWLQAWALAARATVAVANGLPESADVLDRAERALRRVEDEFGLAVVALWRAIAAVAEGEEASRLVEALFDLVGRLGGERILAGPSLYGPRDPAALIPVLLRARSTRFAARAEEILREAFPTVAADPTVTDYHPGYTLRIQLLGAFRVWRGRREVAPRDWQREKAKQLFQLLVTRRGRWFQREEICALLWPEATPDAAEAQFKVALNALNAAIEPRRPARTPPFFVRRHGLAYAFAPTSGVWIDVDEFDVRVAGAARGDEPFAMRALASALALYRGDYLAEALYDPWTTEERERLLARYRRAALDLGQRLLAAGKVEDAIALGEAVLQRDRADERAHQLLMRAYALTGDRAAAARVYRRCRQAVLEELGVPPLPETDALFERIRQGLPVSS